MSTIIIYSSKYGCTTDCAKYLKSALSGSVTLTDIDNTNVVSLDNYDTVIIGSSIYIGKISKKIQQLCKEKLNLLNQKKVGIFLCCAFPEQINEYLTTNFPSALLECAATVKCFGGEARVDKMKFIDKSIMKAALKGNNKKLQISHKNMDSFIKELNSR